VGERVNPSAEDLLSIPLFAGLEPAAVGEIASWFEVEEREAGAPLTREGAAGYAFYVIQDGTATVLHDDEPIRELNRGDFFGELSIIGDGHRTASVKARSPVTVWSMFGTRFRGLEARYPEFAERIRAKYA
jgi:CRP-like cAMP-binding protein